jgi:hypothetical protein
MKSATRCVKRCLRLPAYSGIYCALSTSAWSGTWVRCEEDVPNRQQTRIYSRGALRIGERVDIGGDGISRMGAW